MRKALIYCRSAHLALDKAASFADFQGPGSGAERDVVAARERSVLDLQHAVDKIGSELAGIATRDAEARRELQGALDQDHAKRREELDHEHRSKLEQLEQQRRDQEEALRQRAQEFDEQRRQFDTQQAKYARRKLLLDLTAVLEKAEQLELSEGTQRKRWWVHGFTWLMLLCSATAGLHIGGLALTKDADAKLLALLAASSITFFATLLYYLKWNDRWFREHAESELASKRYQSDMLGASWLAELISELGEEERQLPDTLLDAFTRNLFANASPLRESEHPFDYLPGLLKRATEFDLSKGALRVRAARGDAATKDGAGAGSGVTDAAGSRNTCGSAPQAVHR